MFHDKRHPAETGAAEIRDCLTHSAVEKNVAASTRNVAFNALLFLYKQVLEISLPNIEGVFRARKRRRHHTAESTVQEAVKRTVGKLGLSKHASRHTFRRSFAAHLLENHYDVRTVQELPGRKDVRMTQIYTHVIQNKSIVRSPLDLV